MFRNLMHSMGHRHGEWSWGYRDGDHRSVQIGGAETLAARQILHEARIADQDGVVASLKGERASDVIIRRGFDGGDAQTRKRRLHVVDDLLVAGSIVVKNRLIVRAVTSVVSRLRHHYAGGNSGGIACDGARRGELLLR